MAKVFKSSVLMRRIKRLEDAAVNLSWKGSTHPDDHDAIDRSYHKARIALVEYVLEHVLAGPDE